MTSMKERKIGKLNFYLKKWKKLLLCRTYVDRKILFYILLVDYAARSKASQVEVQACQMFQSKEPRIYRIFHFHAHDHLRFDSIDISCRQVSSDEASFSLAVCIVHWFNNAAAKRIASSAPEGLAAARQAAAFHPLDRPSRNRRGTREHVGDRFSRSGAPIESSVKRSVRPRLTFY